MTKERRLIDVDSFKKESVFDYYSDRDLYYPYCVGYNNALNRVEESLDAAPTVDAAEVVHAEWLDIRFDSMWRSMLATCSHCKVRGEVRVKSNECGFAVPDSDYCPNCGAKMDGGSNK